MPAGGDWPRRPLLYGGPSEVTPVVPLKYRFVSAYKRKYLRSTVVYGVIEHPIFMATYSAESEHRL